MPIRLLCLALVSAVVLTAATHLMWLDPVATDREATFDPGLLGVWSETGGRDLLIFRRNGDSAYTTKYGADDRAHSDDIARMERVAPVVLPPAR